jgi:predicted dehydrogenase
VRSATYRWGIAGPGGIAARFAGVFSLVERAELAAVASRSRARADSFADRYGIPVRHGSYEDLADDPEVDIVYIATPHARHAADAINFLEAGKHVLCEKPLALNAIQARAMATAARENDRFLMEAMWSRFLPAYRTLVAVIEAGTIGEPLVVEADFGFRMPVMAEHRLFDPGLGGGALLDLGIYPAQLCSLVLGTADRVAAQGHVGPTGVDEQVAAVLHHPGGQLGIVKAAIRVAMSCTGRISGSDGWIELPRFMHCPDALVVGTAAGEKRIDASFSGDGLRFQVDEVHRCLDAGSIESPVMPPAESVALAQTLDAIRAEIGLANPGE